MLADFSDKTLSIYDVIREALKDLDIGILINNVGVIVPHPMYFNDVEESLLFAHCQVNVASVALMTRMVLPWMEKRKRGAVINMGSGSALHPLPMMAPYSASKAFVQYLTEALSYEYAGSGISIMTLEPMYVSTRMVGYRSVLFNSEI